MENFKFKILEIKQNPDVTTIKAALRQSYLRQLENELEPGEII
ncbi:hypothetical protein [Clostridium sp.]|jgi:hypothetical protein|nr:hypothetical protein [Clostridium sp.]